MYLVVPFALASLVPFQSFLSPPLSKGGLGGSKPSPSSGSRD